MDKIIKRAFIDSVGTTTYIILVVSFIFSLQSFQKSEDNLIIPIAMLLLFVCSAAITGFLVFGKSIMLYLDGKGIISSSRHDLNKYKSNIAHITNPLHESGFLLDALKDADVCIAVSGKKDLLTTNLIKQMNKKPIIFALSNPDPEIKPDKAKKAGAFIIATGSSIYKNTVNNSLVFPFLMRKILNEKIKTLDLALFHRVALKIANSIKPSVNHITSSIAERREVKL